MKFAPLLLTLALLAGCATAPEVPVATPAAAPDMQQRVRELRGALNRSAEQKAATAPALAAIETRTIAGPGGALPLRIYRGTDAPNAPAILALHGGGWAAGSSTTHEVINRRLALALGAVLVSVDYRLAPEHPFPAATEDADAALAWLFANARRLGVDARRIAVAGDSSGGNLATVAAAHHQARGGRRLAALLLVNPVLNIATLDTESYRRVGAGQMRDFVGWYVPPGTDTAHADLSPALLPDVRVLPPTLVISSENDALRDEDEAFARRLQSSGVRAELFRQDGTPHFGMRWANADPSVEQSVQVAIRFLQGRLRAPH